MSAMSGDEMLTASLAPFERAASCFDIAIGAARDSIFASDTDRRIDSTRALVEIDDMLRLLKIQACGAIGRLATSDIAEHRALAEACRTRVADAINLHRAASRCITQGFVPPLPESRGGPVGPQATSDPAGPWNTHPMWIAAWFLAWSMAWRPGKM